VAGEEP